MTINVTIYGFAQISIDENGALDSTKYYFLKEDLRDDCMMIRIADFPEDIIESFEYIKEIPI